MAHVDYVLVGHIAADILPEGGRTLGGTVGYAAGVAQAFGLRVGLLTSAAPDDPLLHDLPPDVAVHVIPAQATTTYENIYTASGRVQYVRATAQTITAAHIPSAWQDAPLVHIAPIADEVHTSVIAAFPFSSVLLTPQGWMRQWDVTGRVHFKRWLDASALHRARLVVMSEEDIREVPTVEAEYAAHTHTLIITQGAQGGRYYMDGIRYTYDAVPAQAMIDPTGAGDVFAASCLAAWHRTGDMPSAIAMAARVAAWSVGQAGVRASIPPPEWVKTNL